MHRLAEIIKPGTIDIIEQKHRCAGGDAHSGQIHTWKEAGRNFGQGGVALGDLERIGPGHTGAVHQGVDGHKCGVRRCRLDPEIAEDRKFLGPIGGGIQGQAPGRQAVSLPAPDGPKIAGPLKHCIFLKQARLFNLAQQPKACKTRALLGQGRKVTCRLKVPQAERDRARLALHHGVQPDFMRKIQARHKKLGLHRARFTPEQCVASVKPDAPEGVIAQVQPVLRHRRWRGIGRSGQSPRHCHDISGIEWRGIAQRHPRQFRRILCLRRQQAQCHQTAEQPQGIPP